jgi:hypothetical protein
VGYWLYILYDRIAHIIFRCIWDIENGGWFYLEAKKKGKNRILDIYRKSI